MENDNGRIYYGTGIDNSQLRTDAEESKRILSGITGTAVSEGKQIDDVFNKIGKTAAGVFAVSQMKDFAMQVVTVRGEMQKLEIAFQTMIGNADEANALMSQLIKTAATTPFGVSDISNAARQLLAYGVEADKVNETLIRLGDIAAGLSIPIGDLAYLYGTTMVQGRMYTADLNQFLGRGIPLGEELAKVLGVAENQVRALVEEGKVGFPEVEQAIINLTNEGSKFGGLMEAQSQTISGRISNIEDTIEQMFNQIGQASEGVIGTSLDIITSLVENWETVGKVLLTVIATYGTYKAAVLAVAAAHKLMNIWGTVQAVISLSKSVTSAKDAMLLFNMAVKANPLGLVLSVVAAAATAFNLFSTKSGEAAEMTNKYGDSAAKTISRVETLSMTLNGLTAGTSTHKKVMDELNGILEEYGLQAIKEGDSIDMVNAKRAQAIELIKQEGVERQRANALEQGAQNYATQLSEAQKTLYSDLSGAMTEGTLLLGDNKELQQNAAAISTIIGNVVEQNITEIAGKTGEEYQEGINKIYATIQDRMRAIGISEQSSEPRTELYQLHTTSEGGIRPLLRSREQSVGRRTCRRRGCVDFLRKGRSHRKGFAKAYGGRTRLVREHQKPDVAVLEQYYRLHYPHRRRDSKVDGKYGFGRASKARQTLYGYRSKQPERFVCQRKVFHAATTPATWCRLRHSRRTETDSSR